ncbi:beta-defensin 104A [Macaca thibetana thibetana]|uniref:Beta-defensin n=8 Tax=Cercopithecinae TaxID=9528 RepID=A0A2K5KIB0_CERAT|nr:beta-defensin 104 precursor [Papio anubis]XP_011851049.1 PREDICTED: beta-defensin 104A [Mandrillus leucophaeus]XP_011890930.1 PREDICTED: beta-defensin 104A [Cercocebus atys]XP_050657112.1 beta-defensin 104A [Macaca thibetana thibetana]ABV32003.1 beta-defensin 104 [Macaca arctoides]ABV32004.1 beta-defensin 104 [Macaca tonkeana]ABV32005.1 beta-defensin 104 [Macaca fuscata]ABV32007.1 beta-defensin 104 [Cercopithecus erythrogaster]EHH63972.1 Defensin, beta 104 [Macaca fascicularis]
MQRLVLLLAISLLFYQDLPVRSEFELDRICGYGTARCRNKCRSQEYEIGRCPNSYACCLRKWDESLLNRTKP